MFPAMSVLFAVLLPGLALSSPPVFNQPACHDTVRRVIKVMASSGYLWLLGEEGALYHLDLSSRQLTRDSALGKVADLAAGSGGRLLALSVRAGRTLILDERGNWKTATVVPTTPADTVLVLGVLGPRRAVLTTAAVLVEVREGDWRRRALQGNSRLGSLQPSAMWSNDGSLYVGQDFGEFGGNLWRISLGTGRVTEAVRRKTLDPRMDPVTAVIRDPSDGRCVLAAVGLLHMGMAIGRIIRVCGDSISVPFQEPCPLEPGASRAFQRMCSVPVFGLAEGKDGFWAVTPFGVLRFDRRSICERHPMPKLEDVGGVLMSRDVLGVLLVATDINWKASVSGLTPLIAAVDQ